MRSSSNVFNVNTVFRLLVISLLCSKSAAEVQRLIRKALGRDAEKECPKEQTSYKGQRFTLVAGSPINLSWLGAMPSYVLPLVLGFNTLKSASKGSIGKSPFQSVLKIYMSAFAVVPLLECLIGQDWSNPTAMQFSEGHKKGNRFRGALYAWAAVEFFMTYTYTRIACDRSSLLDFRSRAAIAALLGLMTGGFGITIAHELLHKPRQSDKATAYALLTNVSYLHWAEEHLVGHHDKVATPEDAATSRKGESLYKFLPRTISQSFVSAWHIYSERMRAQGQSPSRASFAMRSFGPPLVWVALLAKLTRRRLGDVATFFAAQSAVAILLLEMVNYIEHYGLARARLADGSYEPVNPTHSWNSAQWLSNIIFFKLQRHSDHHTFPQRPFHLLRNFEESPQMPSGYLGMITLSLFPPVFRRIMDPLVEGINSGEADVKALEKEASQKFAAWSVASCCCIYGAHRAVSRARIGK